MPRRGIKKTQAEFDEYLERRERQRLLPRKGRETPEAVAVMKKRLIQGDGKLAIQKVMLKEPPEKGAGID